MLKLEKYFGRLLNCFIDYIKKKTINIGLIMDKIFPSKKYEFFFVFDEKKVLLKDCERK